MSVGFNAGASQSALSSVISARGSRANLSDCAIRSLAETVPWDIGSQE